MEQNEGQKGGQKRKDKQETENGKRQGGIRTSDLVSRRSLGTSEKTHHATLHGVFFEERH
jgi:hypothetical protein